MKRIYITVALLIVAVCLFSLVTGWMDHSLRPDQTVLFMVLICVFLFGAYRMANRDRLKGRLIGAPIQGDDEEEEGATVQVHFKLSSDMGEEDERQKLLELEESLENLVDKSGKGHLDGNEFGGGEFTLFFYGKDAEALFKVLQPALAASPLIKGGFAVKRDGDEEDTKEVTVKF